MRKFALSQVAGSLAICLITLSVAICCGGCSEEAPPPKPSAYAALDSRFPEGRPGIASTQVRAKDAEYLARIAAAAEELSALQGALARAKAARERYREQVAKMLSVRMGEEPPEVLLEAKLAKDAYYTQLQRAEADAAAAAEAKRVANQELIRARMWADQKAYDAMRLQADEAARAAGEAVRQDEPIGAPPPAVLAAQAKAEAVRTQSAPRPATAPTLETLSNETGKPVQPSSASK